jgi:uncharacterized protein YcsI (UPF0317 family)
MLMANMKVGSDDFANTGRGASPRGGSAPDRAAMARPDIRAAAGGEGFNPTPAEWAAMSPSAARLIFRQERWKGPTFGIAAGFVQANLVILPNRVADDFEAYCRANPRPCPLLERLPRGVSLTRELADGADLRADLPRYRVYRPDGSFTERFNLHGVYRDDMAAFLMGCSFSFEEALTRAGLTPRHIEERVIVPVFRTRYDTTPVGPFGGKLVVTMRPAPLSAVQTAYDVTRPYIRVHGAPLFHGDPSPHGIADITRPDWGSPVTIRPDEVPVFWACGVTSQVAVETALRSGAIDVAITHAPGHMFIADRLNTDFASKE